MYIRYSSLSFTGEAVRGRAAFLYAMKQKRHGGRDSFAYFFYISPAWINCRDAYAASVGGICEECAKVGAIVPGEIVHHVTELTPENIGNAEIAYGWENLRLLCRSCHLKVHGKGVRRWKIDGFGRVQTV